MFALIVAKELKEMVGSVRFAVTFLVSSLLILLAFYVGARNYQVANERHQAAVQENLRGMEGLTDWTRVDNRIALPPQPLEALVTGVSNDIGRNVALKGRREVVLEDSIYAADPIFAVFRFLDLDFVFQVVLSLFAILFVYNAVSGEKEQGTLRLSFAGPVPRHQYILGKVTGAFLGLGVPILIPMLLGCILLPLMGVSLTGDEWVRLALIIVTGLLFLGVFLNLSLMVSSLVHRSSSSFLILLTAWILVVLIIPRTSVLLAGRAVEVMSTDQVSYQKAQFRSQLWEEDKNAMSSFQSTKENATEMLAEFQNFMQEVQDKRQAKIDDFSLRLREQRLNQDSQRQRLALGLARLSPASSFSLASMSLAGTATDLKERYRDQAKEYRNGYDRFVREKSGGLASGGMMIRIMSEKQEEPEPIDPREAPEFRFETPPPSEVIAAALPDLGILGLFNLVFFAGAFSAFQRYDVR